MEEIVYTPIGVFTCSQAQPTDSPRQGVLATESFGVLHMNDEIPVEALHDLEGFDRVWLVYHFHNNTNWKPLVRPPRNSKVKRGVFATRSPYRPNGVGMSCVKLEKIDGRKIYFSGHDLLDGTPVIDVKPYLNYADSFPEAKMGWTQGAKTYQVGTTADFKEKVLWLEENLQKPLLSIIENQLQYEPMNGKIKRVKKTPGGYCFSYRIWRIDFVVKELEVCLLNLRSAYSVNDLSDPLDPYLDKSIHRKFRAKFNKAN